MQRYNSDLSCNLFRAASQFYLTISLKNAFGTRWPFCMAFQFAQPTALLRYYIVLYFNALISCLLPICLFNKTRKIKLQSQRETTCKTRICNDFGTQSIWFFLNPDNFFNQKIYFILTFPMYLGLGHIKPQFKIEKTTSKSNVGFI